VPISLGCSVAGFIAWHDFYSVESMAACWSSVCINDAASRLKIPITIMALIFPAVALVASQHRSAQTVAQIERTDRQITATEAKNAFENCIKHKEMFLEQLTVLEEEHGVKCKKKDLLYSAIFFNNDYINFEVYVNADSFIHKFIRFDDKKSRSEKVEYMSLIIENDLYVDFNHIESDGFGTRETFIINLYSSFISHLLNFCLSPEDFTEAAGSLLGAHELVEEIYQEMF
jgi:hypothetical protein